MRRLLSSAVLLVIAGTLTIPAAAHGEGFGSREFSLTLEGVETHTFTSGGPPESECRSGTAYLSRGSGRQTWTFRSVKPMRVMLSNLGSSAENALMGKGLDTGVRLEGTTTREGSLESYACGQPDYKPRWSPLPFDGCWGTSPMTGQGDFNVGNGEIIFQPRRPEGFPACGWSYFPTLTGSDSRLINAYGPTSFSKLIRTRRPVTVKLIGTTRCNSGMLQSVCNGTVETTVRLTPLGPKVDKSRRRSRARAAQAAPDGKTPSVKLRAFEHWMSTDELARLQIPVVCSEPSSVRMTFRPQYGGPQWEATGQAGPEGALVPATAPQAMIDWLVGKGWIRIQLDVWCIDAAGEESQVRWDTSLTVKGTKRKQIGECRPTYRKTYRLDDLLGAGIAVPVRCDSATRAGVMLLITNEEELGIPSDLWRRHGGTRDEDWSEAGTKTLRLKAADWARRYLRRARKPIAVTLHLGVKTNQEGYLSGSKGTRARIIP